jgi:glycosyltransferase involved in cell wall biosynthesis
VDLAVVIPTARPDLDRLRRTLAALRGQTLAVSQWEAVLVDNTPEHPAELGNFLDGWTNLRLVREPQPGLTHARRCGIHATRAAGIVFVDDDNVLAPDYLAHAMRIFSSHPKLGAFGGRSLPEFGRPPEPWQTEFFPLLALRDPGPDVQIWPKHDQSTRSEVAQYPLTAGPIGAGMAVRRAALESWLNDESAGHTLPDRQAGELSSGGDNDIVLSIVRAGWTVGYFPELVLTHLIPGARLEAEYLARLNRGIQKSWMRVLTRHDANPWPPISRWTLPLRKTKAWIRHRPWSSPAARVRWAGACGHFEGRAR